MPFLYIEPDRSPFSYAPDAPFYLMIVKGAIDHGSSTIRASASRSARRPTISGFSLIASGVGLKEIRSWNRMSVFIGFFALVTVGFGIDALRRRLPNRPWVRPLTVLPLGGLLLLGVLDQFAPRMTPRTTRPRRHSPPTQRSSPTSSTPCPKGRRC